MHDDYKQLETPAGVQMERCPCCGSAPQLWQYSTSPTAPTSKLVMCTNGNPIGPQEGAVNEGCLLYMPPKDFYRETIKDAIRFWNEFAVALVTLRNAEVVGCPNAAHMGEHACTNKAQCWEPCGELGHDERYVRPGTEKDTAALNKALGKTPSVMDRGPWSAHKRTNDGKWCIQSEDFTHDVQLIVYGDFGDDADRKAYAEGIAAQLNAHDMEGTTK